MIIIISNILALEGFKRDNYERQKFTPWFLLIGQVDEKKLQR